LPGVTDSFHVPFLRIFVSSFAWSLILKNALLSVLGAVDRKLVKEEIAQQAQQDLRQRKRGQQRRSPAEELADG